MLYWSTWACHLVHRLSSTQMISRPARVPAQRVVKAQIAQEAFQIADIGSFISGTAATVFAMTLVVCFFLYFAFLASFQYLSSILSEAVFCKARQFRLFESNYGPSGYPEQRLCCHVQKSCFVSSSFQILWDPPGLQYPHMVPARRLLKTLLSACRDSPLVLCYFDLRLW